MLNMLKSLQQDKSHQRNCSLTRSFMFISCLIISLLFSQYLYAESGYKVFQTRQPAQNLLSNIAPLYSDSARFVAKNNQLIVKAPESILIEIEQLLKEIDQPLQNLLIEVSSSLDQNNNRQNNAIGYESEQSTTHAIYTRRRNTNNNPNTYTIRALQGQWSTIQLGKRVPYYMSGGMLNPWQNSTELVDVMSGFEVFPVINGNQVTLRVRPYNSAINNRHPEQINTRSLETSISGQLGEWIFLGGVVNEQNTQQLNNKLAYKNKDINISKYSTKRNSDMESNYSIRVNKID